MLWIQPWVLCLLMVSVHSLVELEDKLKQLDLGLPELFNWETKGCTPGIEYQGNCNAGYAYATAAAIGTAYCVHKQKLLKFLSAKQIIRCSGDYGNNGCEGGSAVNAFEYVNSTDGLNPASLYLIDATAPPCSVTGIDDYKIDGFYHYEDVTEQFLIELLHSEGPLVVGIDASLQSFKEHLGDGVYNDTNCKSGLADLNHDVLLVGYGNDAGVPFWEFVNSWGPFWGAGGRGRIERANNRCGIRTRVSYPVIPQ